MKVFAISDLHLSINNPKPMDIFGGAWDNYVQQICTSWEQNVACADIVLIAGDISWAMTLQNALPDLEFIGSLKGRKVLIRGNHDYWWKSISNVRSSLCQNTFAVQNDCIRIDNVLIAGSRGWTTPEKEHLKEEDKKIYERELIRMELSLSQLNKMRKQGDRAIAMIHYPPFNSRMAQSDFTRLFSKYKIDCVVYGHLHGKSCYSKLQTEIDGVRYFLTSCDLLKNNLAHILSV